jgi:hypothetical protein
MAYYGYDWYFVTNPWLFVAFCALTYYLDHDRKIEFRKPRNMRILVPYLVLFYVGIILMWGLTWALGLVYGAVTGVTYFLQLGASAYAGKHGKG